MEQLEKFTGTKQWYTWFRYTILASFITYVKSSPRELVRLTDDFCYEF